MNKQGRSLHDGFGCARANKAEHRSRADWVARNIERPTDLPSLCGMAVELWFGAIIYQGLLELAHPADRMVIARKFGVPNPDLLVSWVKTLAYVRNLCAHHSRVWNNPLINQPMVPKKNQAPYLSHIGTRPWMQQRVYGAAAVAQHFLRTINPKSTWKIRLGHLWADFPEIPGVNAEHAGFYHDWQAHSLWR